MFNFKKLKLDKRTDEENKSSFVGIHRNKNNELVFRLPKGFETFPENDFDAAKRLFFKMYRTFKKFETDNKSCQIDKYSTGKDNIETAANGYRFLDKENNETIIYSKISVIENLLETYRDLSLDTIIRQRGRDENIDYSQINRYLHKAIYLDDGVVYIDEMNLSRHCLKYTSTTLIDLFCFILYELNLELEQKTDLQVKNFASRFKEQHLSHDQSLFDEKTFEITLVTLKDILNNIDKITAYKDESYWQLYDAVESFLYGELDMQSPHEDGVFWGISNFYQIWEDMCNTYILNQPEKYDVVYADTEITLKGKSVANDSVPGHKLFIKNGFNNPFFIEFRDEKRWMRPDLIHIESNKEELFGSIIKIKINKCHGDRVYFSIRLLVQSADYKKIYVEFCDDLKKTLFGASLKGSVHNHDISFRHYPKEMLDIHTNILKSKFQKDSKTVSVILDWKYMPPSEFLESHKKLDTDITKQLCYEFALQQSQPEYETVSRFVIPFFYKKTSSDDIGSLMDEKELYGRLNENKIQVFKANFEKIQGVYLNHDQ